MASFATSRVFRACTAMFAQAKSSAAAATTSTTVPKKATAAKTAPKPKPKRAPPSSQAGILKTTPVSPALRSFLGVSEASRTDVVKRIWAHVKAHNLQDPANKREIICDEKLKVIFGKERVGFLEIGKLLTPHFVKTG